jgi:dTDP-4-dehydrorhamnose reductase
MLGSTVLHRLRTSHGSWRVDGASRGQPARLTIDAEAGRPGIADLFRLGRYDYVINCIGVLKGEIDDRRSESIERAIRVNGLFPHEIADVAAQHGARIVHISTDAVFSGRQSAPYSETSPPDPNDLYGATKLLGESPTPNTLNVRCSIVGRDRRQRGLLEWYLAADTRSVPGFDDYVWTPVTTVQVADKCGEIIAKGFDTARAAGSVLHFAPNPALSKAVFLETVRAVLGRGPAIERTPSPDGPRARILSSRWAAPDTSPSADAGWPQLIRDVMSEFASRGL